MTFENYYKLEEKARTLGLHSTNCPALNNIVTVLKARKIIDEEFKQCLCSLSSDNYATNIVQKCYDNIIKDFDKAVEDYAKFVEEYFPYS